MRHRHSQLCNNHIKEPAIHIMNIWLTDWLTEWIDEWMTGWMDELLFHQPMPVNMAVIVFGCYGNSAKSWHLCLSLTLIPRAHIHYMSYWVIRTLISRQRTYKQWPTGWSHNKIQMGLGVLLSTFLMEAT